MQRRAVWLAVLSSFRFRRFRVVVGGGLRKPTEPKGGGGTLKSRGKSLGRLHQLVTTHFDIDSFSCPMWDGRGIRVLVDRLRDG